MSMDAQADHAALREAICRAGRQIYGRKPLNAKPMNRSTCKDMPE